ncbi:hypothetical protein D3C87_1748830 [compost metagenome]
MADQAASDDVGAGFRVAVFNGVERVAVGCGHVEQGNLLPVQQDDHAGIGHQVIAGADGTPGQRGGSDNGSGG